MDGNLAIGDTSGTSGDDLVDHLLLDIVQSIREVNHLVRSLLEVLGIGEEHGANKVLLSINSSLGRSVLGGLAGVNARNVSRSGDRRSTASTTVGTATALDGTDLAGGVNTNVGTENNKAGTAIGDVRGHGAEGGLTAEGEASKAAHAEVVVVNLLEIVLEDAVDLIGAEGGGNERVGSVSVLLELLSDGGNEVGVLLRLGEVGLDGLLHGGAEGELANANLLTKVLGHGSVVVVNLERKREEVIGHTSGGIDLDTTKDGNLAITGNVSSASLDDSVHELLLGIVQSIREVNHLVSGLLKLLGIGEEHGANKVLLSIIGGGGGTVLGGLTGVNAGGITRGSDRRSTGSTTVGTATALDGTDLAGGVNTNVGTENNKAGTAIGDVRGHGTERSDTTEREAYQIYICDKRKCEHC